MKKTVTEVLSRLNRIISVKDRDEQIAIFRSFIDICNDASYNACLSKELLFNALNGIKSYFFSTMEDYEHNLYVDVCLKYIREKREFYYQLLETLSVFYKELSPELQNDIINVFDSISMDLLKSNRGITTFSIFIKNTHKVYNSEQKIKLGFYLQQLRTTCLSKELKDTYEYHLVNCNRHFVSTTQNVLLLIPEFQTATSFVQPPLCFLGVGTRLKEASIDFDLLDNRVYSYSTTQLIDIVKRYHYIICTSSPLDQVQTYFLDHRYTIFTNTIKAIKNHIGIDQKVIICGAHTTVRPDLVCRDVPADIFLKGEYDIQLFNLIKIILNNGSICNMPNLIFRRNNGTLQETDVDDSLMHPNEWSNKYIDYSIISSSDYYGYQYVGNTHLKKKNHSVVQASRGCPFRCIFCYNFYSHSMRYKDVDILIRELQILSSTGVEEFFFIDQTFTVNKEFVIKLCKAMIDNSLKLRWTCETRIELIDEELISVMKDAGCFGIWFGVESFDEQVLNINKKGYIPSDYTRTIELLKKYDIDYRAFIMLGMKGDTKDSLQKTITTITSNKIHISKTIVRCKVRFGTELFYELPIHEQETINSFEELGLYKSNLSSVEPEYLIKAEQELMRLNRN